MNKVKLLYTGDWHLRGNNPRNRIDNYVDAADRKLYELFQLATDFNVEAILMPGDLWDRPEVAISILLHYASILSKSPVPIIVTIGNHDIYGYNISSYERTSLKLLEILVPQLEVLYQPDEYRKLGSRVYLTATPYSSRIDIDGYGYSPEEGLLPRDAAQGLVIHMAHGMLLDHIPPFDRYTTIQGVKTTADLVLSGHDHKGFGVYKRPDGVTFCNPGAMLRISASVSEIERTVQVALITADTVARKVDVKLVPLQQAAPGDQVLDRSKVEESKQRQYAMENFSALIQSHTGGKVLLDVNQIVDTIAAQEGYAPEVVRTALAIIDQQREVVKGG